jgi:Fe-S oxidoreductase
MVASGFAPEGLKEATERAVKIGSPMGVTLPTLQAQIRRIQTETGLEVPVDVQGADYLALFSSMEVVNFPEYIEALTRIFKQAGVSWTISSKAFEATNSGIQIGDSAVAAELVGRVVKAAEELGIKYLISPECGHAYIAIRWEGPDLLGRPLPFQVVHILELLDRLRAEGRLRMVGKEDQRLTFHDPCQIVRRGGVVQPPRHLLDMVASDFVEMPDHGVMNWCCGGGGGVSANERAEQLRLKVFDRKAKQLEAVKPEMLVTACANCRIMLEEGLEQKEMDIPVVGITELLADHLAEPRTPQASG